VREGGWINVSCSAKNAALNATFKANIWRAHDNGQSKKRMRIDNPENCLLWELIPKLFFMK
jgi:hypothetical protein